jgi:membrane protease YdiL (CAAX protease family)
MFDLPVTGEERRSERAQERSNAWVRWPGWLRAFLFFTAGFLVYSIGQAIGLAIAGAILVIRGQAPAFEPERIPETLEWLTVQPVVIVAVGFFGLVGALLITLAFARGLDRRPLASVGLQADRVAAREFGSGLALGAGLIGAIFAVEAALGWLQVTRVAPGPQVLAHTALWFVVLLPAAASEEVLLRGYAFQALEEQWNDKAATVITAVLFGLLHAANPSSGWAAIWGIVAPGILFGVAVLVTRRLWLPIGLHVSWNLFEGPVLGFPVSGFQLPSVVRTEVTGPTLWTGGRFGPEAGLLVVFACLLGIIILLGVRRKLGVTPPAPPR